MPPQFDDDKIRAQMAARAKAYAERRQELIELGYDMTTCDTCRKPVRADEALSNGGSCDDCAYGWDGD